MKFLFAVVVTVLSFCLVTPALAIDSDELPFGSIYMDTAYSSADLARLDSMCFNHFMEYRNILNNWRIDSLFNRGMQAVRGGLYPSLVDAEPQVKYSWTNYAVIDVDYPYPNEEVRMEATGGSYSDGKWISARGNSNTLSGISTWQSPNYLRNGVRFYTNYFFGFFRPEFTGRIKYRFDIQMSIDSLAGDSPSDTVAHVYFSVGGDAWDLCQTDTIQDNIILASDCGPAGVVWPCTLRFQIPDAPTIINWKSRSGSSCGIDHEDTLLNTWYHLQLFLGIQTTGERQVAIDKIVISDFYGRNLIIDTLYNPAIRASFSQYSGAAAKIYGWHLMDEAQFLNFMPVAHIRGLMNSNYSQWTLPINVWPSTPQGKLAHSYLTMVDSTILNPDIHPIGLTDPYSGIYFQDEVNDVYGPLKNFNRFLGWHRNWVEEEGLPDAFWVTLQSNDETLRSPDKPQYHRFPTSSELSCITYMSLSWGVKGIQYWFYDQGHNYGNGIIDTAGNPTALYYQIKDHIGPYIQAFDEYYVPLDWERTYPYHATSPVFNPPAGAYVSSISSASIIGGLVTENDPNVNPDRGWFHVGEYTKGNDKYIMLVNRACSRGPSDSTEAPSITATVRFNPGNLNLGDYVYVIDLADSIYRAGGDTGWVGIPQTTYTALMPDGTIPFTTTLRAGEGRLFKIVQANEIFWSGPITTTFIYQGRIKITGDARVYPSTTLRIRGPARFEVFRCDDLFSGQNTGLVELNVDGKLLAEGYYANPIVFYPDTIYMCDSLTRNYPMPGDWYGIFIDQGDTCELSYCQVSYGEYGVDSQNNSHVAVSHSTVEHNKHVGLHCFKGYMDVTNSSINWNELYGVQGYDADVDVAHCNFLGDGLSGIKLVGSATSDTTYVQYDTVISTTSTQQNGYGISISSNDRVRIYKCKSWGYTQAGLYLSNSDASISHNDFSGNYYYGVYADNYSFPKIRQCRIDTLTIGVKTYQSKPNIGRIEATADSGNCSFLSCSRYYIYHSYQSVVTADTVCLQTNLDTLYLNLRDTFSISKSFRF